jgi:hypothetical protein
MLTIKQSACQTPRPATLASALATPGHLGSGGNFKGGADDVILNTAGDLAAAMELNPYLKVFSANGYYDAVTPFFQTKLNFDEMPCSEKRRDEIQTVNYASGHMICAHVAKKSYWWCGTGRLSSIATKHHQMPIWRGF